MKLKQRIEPIRKSFGKYFRTMKKRHKQSLSWSIAMFVLLNDFPIVLILHKDNYYWLISEVGYMAEYVEQMNEKNQKNNDIKTLL